tara:strand:- start:8 stop:445 length:438 start_codon:yes stop_codon:yes gene_type:complete
METPTDPNIYHYSTYDSVTGKYIPQTYTPPLQAIGAMNKIRHFIKSNKLPMDIYPIGAQRINFIVKTIVNEPRERRLCKIIMSSTGMFRLGSIMWAPRAILYQAQDWEEIESDFNMEQIKAEWARKCQNEPGPDFETTWNNLINR